MSRNHCHTKSDTLSIGISEIEPTGSQLWQLKTTVIVHAIHTISPQINQSTEISIPLGFESTINLSRTIVKQCF